MILRAVLLVVGAIVFLGSASAQPTPAPDASAFRVVFEKDIRPDAYTGRVYVVLGRSGRPEPRRQMSNWFNPALVLAVDVKDMKPGLPVAVDAGSMGYPHRLAEIPAGVYWAQAVARCSLDEPTPGDGPGDLYSKPVQMRFDAAGNAVLELKLTEVVPEPPFHETEEIKLVTMRSKLLSEFHGRDYTVRAAIGLPPGWADEPERRWPSLVMIGGFGGSHRDIARMAPLLELEDGSRAGCVVVVPDPSCGTGHSVFADSANNGPWGRVLTEELLPEIDRKFRTSGPATRHVAGISSGGWASLWLVVTQPEQFAACWSHVPDPVDFRDFQRIDLYAPDANMYTDAAGARRPLARNGGETLLWYDNFCRMENVLGRGGQIGSFEAVFSPRLPDGKPRPLFDRETGRVDHETAMAWEPYDVRLRIERGWQGTDGAPGLRERLKGKVHVYAGEQDNFFLDGAAKLLKESLADLGGDAEVIIVPGMGHTFFPDGNRKMIEALNAASEPAAAASPR